jgi:hypothetical protein
MSQQVCSSPAPDSSRGMFLSLLSQIALCRTQISNRRRCPQLSGKKLLTRKQSNSKFSATIVRGFVQPPTLHADTEYFTMNLPSRVSPQPPLHSLRDTYPHIGMPRIPPAGLSCLLQYSEECPSGTPYLNSVSDRGYVPRFQNVGRNYNNFSLRQAPWPS